MSQWSKLLEGDEARDQLGVNIALMKSGDHPPQVDPSSYITAGEELMSNWDQYGDRLYHGTAQENIGEILKEGAIVPGEDNEASTGEMGNQGKVYYSSLIHAGSHYAESAHPTREEILEAAKNDLDFEEEFDLAPEELDYAHLHDIMTKGINGDFKEEEFLQSERGYVSGRYKAAYERFSKIPEDKPEPLLIGFGPQNIVNGSIPPDYNHEFEAIENEDHLAEGSASRVLLDENVSLYFSQPNVESLREKYHNFPGKILSLDSLKLKHQIKMRDIYGPENHPVNFEPVWKGEIRTVTLNEDTPPTPFGKIKISG
ncbi:MAG: hypothetical protein ABEJ93_01150 [Candidatus Nanohalobium sp.]